MEYGPCELKNRASTRPIVRFEVGRRPRSGLARNPESGDRAIQYSFRREPVVLNKGTFLPLRCLMTRCSLQQSASVFATVFLAAFVPPPWRDDHQAFGPDVAASRSAQGNLAEASVYGSHVDFEMPQQKKPGIKLCCREAVAATQETMDSGTGGAKHSQPDSRCDDKGVWRDRTGDETVTRCCW